MGKSGTPWRLGYRPGLDGLRGVAILLVVASHANVPGLNGGGRVGVGLFFTLSGFLITGLLVEELERDGRIAFGAFYARRARRLFPALAVLVLAVVVASAFLGPWWLEWAAVPAALLYVGNWVPINGGSLGALGHTWTLSIEEQFYIVWPLAVAALGTRHRVVRAAAALAGASLVWRWVLLANGEVGLRVPLGSDTVAVAILVGALTVGIRKAAGSGAPPRLLLSVAGVGLVIGMVMPDVWYLFFGLPTVAVATACALWAVSGDARTRWLEVTWLRWFGARSYGIYLWHAPLLWVMWYRLDLSWPVLVSIGVPVSLLLAEASYRWVESPFRRSRPGTDSSTREQRGRPVEANSGVRDTSS